MATETTKKLRNWAHPITTAILLYFIGHYFEMFDYLFDPNEIEKSIFQIILFTLFSGFIGGGGFGLAYEILYKLWIFKEKDDWMDIMRSAYGGPIGLLIYFIFPFVPVFILKTLLWIIGIGLVLDLINSIINKVKSLKNKRRWQK